MNVRRIVMGILSISFTILVFLLIIYGLYQIGQISYKFGYRLFAEPAVADEEDGSERLVRIKKSMNAADVGGLLEAEGLVRDKWLFAAQLTLSRYNNALVPGEYTLSTSMTADEMLEILSGQASAEEEGEEGTQGPGDKHEKKDKKKKDKKAAGTENTGGAGSTGGAGTG